MLLQLRRSAELTRIVVGEKSSIGRSYGFFFSEEGFVLISKQNWNHIQIHNHLSRVISMMAFIEDHT